MANASAIWKTSVYGVSAYHAKCLRCDWQSRRFNMPEQAVMAAKKHAVKHLKGS
jgi:hypothetical protein